MAKSHINDSEVQKHIQKFSKQIPKSLGDGVALGFDMIGQRAQSNYFRNMGGEAFPGLQGPQAYLKEVYKSKAIHGKLTVRSGRLAKSLAPQGGARNKGSASEQIRNIRIGQNKIVGFFGSRVPYARIHEEGGSFVHPNLFGRGIVATIRMRKRPYLKPAARDVADKIRSMLAEKFAKTWNVK